MAAAELWLWVLTILGISYWGYQLHPVAASAASLGTIAGNLGAFNVVAWILILGRVRRIETGSEATAGSIVVGIFVCVASLSPARSMTGIALSILGGWLLFQTRRRREGREAAGLILALALTVIWSSFYIAPIHLMAAGIDARIVGWLLRLLGYGVTVRGNLIASQTGHFELEVLVACSSSIQFGTVVLAYVVTKSAMGSEFRRPDWFWLLGALGLSAAITECRLTFMGTSESNYFWWHDGPGSAIYEVTATLGAIAVPVLSVWLQATPRTVSQRRGAL